MGIKLFRDSCYLCTRMKVNDGTLWLQGLLLDREGRQVQRLPLEMECAGEIKREQASQSNERRRGGSFCLLGRENMGNKERRGQDFDDAWRW